MIHLSPAIQQEHEIAAIISQQQINGWEFDLPAALELYSELEDRKEEIYSLVRPHLKVELTHERAPVLNPWLKNNKGYIKRALNYWGPEDIMMVDGAYSPVDFLEPDIGSRQKLMKQLSVYGWEPVNFTEKGNPKLDDESLEGLDLGETGNLLMEYFKASQRASTLLGQKADSGWLRNCYPVAEDRWRIVAGANPCGTNTHRMQHRTVVNVPKASDKVYYGRRMRELFIAAPGMKLFGGDAEQLELRCLASYMGDEELIALVLSGDFHDLIWEPIKEFVESRDNAKNIEYALLYGASDTKLGRMADYNPHGWPLYRLGGEIRKRVMEFLPAMDNFIETCKRASRRGWLKGIDGFPIYMRRGDNNHVLEHKAVNTVLQHCGSMVFKRANILYTKMCAENQLPMIQVGQFHDELQHEGSEKHSNDYNTLFQLSMKQAGESYGLACPMDGKIMMGDSWADTH